MSEEGINIGPGVIVNKDGWVYLWQRFSSHVIGPHQPIILAAIGSDGPEPEQQVDQEADANQEPIAVCVCSIQDLMVQGCRCGAVNRPASQ